MRQQSHKRGRAWAPAQAPLTPQGRVPPWALGSTGQPNLHVPTPTRHTAKTTTAERAWARLGARPGAANATRRCTSLGVGLHRPTKPPRPHPDAPHRENDNSRTCVGTPGRPPGRHKRHKEVYLLGRWAPQAEEYSASSPPPLHKRHNAKTTTAARAWASLGASPGAASATTRCTSLGVGLLKPSKTPRTSPRPATTRKRQPPHVRCGAWAPTRAPQTPQGGNPPWAFSYSDRQTLSVLTSTSPQAPQREDNNGRTYVGALGRQPGRHNATRRYVFLGVGLLKPSKAPHTSPQAPQRKCDNSRTSVGELGRQPRRH